MPEDKHRNWQKISSGGWLLGVAALTFLLPAGCGPMYKKPLEREPATQAERNFRDLWQASCATLKKYGFTIDRQDRRDGVITTYAMSGGHGLEALWRKDASNFYQFQENTAQNILRAACVKLRRLPDHPDEFDFQVEVRMARTDRPQPQLTDASEINKMNVQNLPELRFSDLEMRRVRWDEKLKGSKAYIVPLGSDERLAWRIDRSIRARAGLPDRSVPETPETLQKDESSPESLPEVSTGSNRRTVILAGPLEEPRKVSPETQPASSPVTPPVQEQEAKTSVAAAPPAAVLQGQEKDHLVCSLRTADHAETTTTPVSMIFRLKNVGKTPLRLSQPKHGITLFGRYRKVGEKRWGGAPPSDRIELPAVTEIAPGETLDVPVKFGFGSAGEYEMYYRYSARPGRDTNWSGDLDSNILKLTITGVK